MKHRPSMLRKAAILIASLDQPTAESVLDQMDLAQADRVRRAILHLGDVDAEEQDRVIEEFFRIGPLIPSQNPAGIELDGDVALHLSSDTPSEESEPRRWTSDFSESWMPRETKARIKPNASDVNNDSAPFQFLHEAEFETLAPFLKRENPQTIAVVVSHLPPQRAGELLAELPANLQVEVIRRLVDLDKADPRMVREVERGLETWLSEQARNQRRRAAGIEAVSAILTAASGSTRRKILGNVTRHDRPLAGKLRTDHFRFADFVQLDDSTIGEVLRAADPELLVLALAGASADWVQRFTRRLPAADARRLNRALIHLGPTRLADVEEAQQALADLALDLEGEGRIALGSGPRLSATA